MKYSSNITPGIVGLKKKLASLQTDQILRAVATNQLARMKTRIHENGLDANDAAIGEYSSGYLKLRAKKNRGSESKVIASFTGQLENDTVIVGIANGYAIANTNSDNSAKRGYVQDTYNKKIWGISKSERSELKKDGIAYIREVLK